MSQFTIKSNVASLLVQRRLASSTEALEETLTRLSSGLRINKASDDAAGLAVSAGLETDQRVYAQGIRNLNDGVSALSIAESTLEQLSAITTRLRELATQSANGTISSTQRVALDEEAQALSEEFARIARATSFNGLELFNGQTASIRLQAGYGLDEGIEASIGGAIGTGSFDSATTFTGASFFNRALAVGDLNGDGIIDLVTTGRNDSLEGEVTVRLGQGDGSFGAATTYLAEATESRALALGDINNDGILDLVTTGDDGSSNGSTTVRLGQGNGTFGAATSYTAETTDSNAVVLGDFNNDGILDLVTAGTETNDGYATLRLGRGDGTFGGATSFLDSSTEQAFGLSVGDVNNDGNLDLITSGKGDAFGYARVRFGQGDGTFSSSTSYAMEAAASSNVVLGDLNGDGILDLVTSGYDATVDGFATVRLGQSDGTFAAATSYAAESFVSDGLALGDLNGDGFLDLITAGQTDGTSGETNIRFGNGDGTFGAATSYTTEQTRSYGVVVGDTNGDGVLDLLTTGQNGSDGATIVRLGSTTPGAAPLLPFSLKTRADALQAFGVFDNKLTQLSQQRGEIGAAQSRIEVALNLLAITEENYAAAVGRIRDADVAAEASKLVRHSILQQAGAAVLAQANQQTSLVLSLLGVE